MKKMLLPLICILLVLTLSACSGGKKEKEEEQARPQSSGEIMDNYVNTLTTAQDRAKKAVKISEDRVQKQQGIMDELERTE